MPLRMMIVEWIKRGLAAEIQRRAELAQEIFMRRHCCGADGIQLKGDCQNSYYARQY
jgi:hypothetical protein